MKVKDWILNWIGLDDSQQKKRDIEFLVELGLPMKVKDWILNWIGLDDSQQKKNDIEILVELGLVIINKSKKYWIFFSVELGDSSCG